MNSQIIHLLPEIQRAADERGYTNWTTIQEKAIPIAIDGKDIISSGLTDKEGDSVEIEWDGSDFLIVGFLGIWTREA